MTHNYQKCKDVFEGVVVLNSLGVGQCLSAKCLQIGVDFSSAAGYAPIR
jgi:hypothetical protein